MFLSNANNWLDILPGSNAKLGAVIKNETSHGFEKYITQIMINMHNSFAVRKCVWMMKKNPF